MTELDDLYSQLARQNKEAMRYTRMRLLATWLAVALLAVLTGVTLIATGQNTQTDIQQTEDIARVANTTADHASAQADQTTAYLKGDTGIPGVPGSNGQDGSPGLPSSEPGPKGEAGPKGDTGTMGAAGPSGTAGPVGLSGSAGPNGPAGSAGTDGTAGEQGAQGPKGDKGDQGAQGPAGAQGPPGPQGPAGPPGFNTTTIIAAASANDTTATKSVQATCTTGRASGGGFATVPSDPGIDVSASSPVGNTGWNATADVLSLPAGTNWQLLVFVTCVS